MLQEEITALGLAMCVQSNAKAMEISDGTVENEDTLPQEIRGAFSEELYTIRNLEATTTRLVISYCESCHENCHSLCLRGQGKVHHSKLQPRKAPMEMLITQLLWPKPLPQSLRDGTEEFILTLPQNEFLVWMGSSCRL